MSFTPEKLAQRLRSATAANPVPRRWVVAYSGGLDSSALLRALARAGLQQPLCALHINHGLSPNSDDWQAHCAAVCGHLGIDFHCRQVTVESRGKGLEEAARRARYRAFEGFLEAGDCLLMAHHQDDQAETLLLRLLRGSGPRGLGAMAASRRLGRGWLLRPLLEFSRAELRLFLQGEAAGSQEPVDWIEDESNRDEGFDRNFLRNRVMPVLAQRWPDVSRRWQRSAELCRETHELNTLLAESDLALLNPRRERLGTSLELPPLRHWPPVRRYNVLRHWFETLAVAIPQRIYLRQVDEQLVFGRADSQPRVTWGGHALCRYRDRLYCLPLAALERGGADAELLRDWPLGGATPLPLALPGGASLQAVWETQGECLALPAGGYTPTVAQVRGRRGGERCQPQGRRHSQTLKKLLQEYGLEPWLRDRVPLLYIGGQLAAVGDLWVSEAFAAKPGERGLRLTWYIN